MANGPRWKSIPHNLRTKIADDLRTYSAFYVSHKYGVSLRTVANWRRYADARPVNNPRLRQENYKRTPEEIERARNREPDEDDDRDDMILAVYQELRCDTGTTSREIAKRTGYPAMKVFADLNYLKAGRMAECRRGRWYAVKPSTNEAGKMFDRESGYQVKVFSKTFLHGIPAGMRRVG